VDSGEVEAKNSDVREVKLGQKPQFIELKRHPCACVGCDMRTVDWDRLRG